MTSPAIQQSLLFQRVEILALVTTIILYQSIWKYKGNKKVTKRHNKRPNDSISCTHVVYVETLGGLQKRLSLDSMYISLGEVWQCSV